MVDSVPPLPVIAAGGIHDGRGLAAALMLGACGVMIGTRFMASMEALIAADARERLVAADGDATVRTRIFDLVSGSLWPDEYSGRALRNRFSEAWHGNEQALIIDLERQRRLYRDAYTRKDFDIAVVYAGESVDGIHQVEPAATIVGQIVNQAQALLGISTPPIRT